MLSKRVFTLLCVIGIAVNGIGLFTGVMMIDGALYALIAKNMVLAGNYEFLTLHGFDWLDKPHFPFWCTALSYRVFGIDDFAYKLPAFVFWLIGALYTYLLARRLHGGHVARIAVLVYLSALHLLVCNSAVNAEPYLTGMIVAAIYHFHRAYRNNTFHQLILGALWSAAAVMTKGIFVLIIIGGGFIVLWLIRKEWRQFLNYRWYLAVALLLVFILPELCCLYRQFDARPEVEVFGQKGVSGIRFFFWDSQFGRFFNSGPIKGHGDPFFYLHTTLWAFLPWSPLLLSAAYFSVGRKTKIGHPLVWGTVSVALLLFSASQFQLPHYLNALFPLMSIWVAQLLTRMDRLPAGGVMHRIQWYSGLLIVVLLGVLSFLFHSWDWWGYCAFIAIAGGLALVFTRQVSTNNTLCVSYSVGLLIGMFYGGYLYPGLLTYQSGDRMAHFINTRIAGGGWPDHIYVLDYEINNFTLGFQSDVPLQAIRSGEQWETIGDDCWLAVNTERMSEIPDRYKVEMVASFSGYRVSRLTPKFFYYRTRGAQLGQFHLVRLKRR
ncbi:ArnT family glycosyltransferase [Parapedobacter sp. DT-150]|uniref:ArnT family glycosyltransferase n=1 Tax=Parapedobacter sp. DT-150 TaxID=3396162 RepID=UPI003F1AB799